MSGQGLIKDVAGVLVRVWPEVAEGVQGLRRALMAKSVMVNGSRVVLRALVEDADDPARSISPHSPTLSLW